MRSHETFSTTADSGIRFRGRGYPELYANALRGLNALLFGRGGRPGGGGGSLRYRFRGDGPENVLVNFLSEALFQAGRRGRRVNAVIRRAGRDFLEADLLFGRRRSVPRVEVKAVTYHGLRVRRKGGVLNAAVIVDV
ncbi:MAG TPA: archease [Candidatus Aminicenantes bacterium]|nr:archease [Candidatus Aminicenantes bacterium]